MKSMYPLNTLRAISPMLMVCVIFSCTHRLNADRATTKNKRADTLGLTHRYSFTTNANDAIGNANGTLEGNATISKGRVVLDGTKGTYINLPPGLMTGYTNVTYECWVNIGENGNYARIFDMGSINGNSGQHNLYLCVYHTSTKDWRLMITEPARKSKVISIPGTLSNRGYVHLAGVFNTVTGFMGLYANGELVGSVKDLSSLAGVDPGYFFLGRSSYASDAYLKGGFDEFRMYNKALSAEQIAANYKNGPDAKKL